jgi:lipopolysaccharide export system permease protein
MYLDVKNKYSKDNKYLAIVTENGLWIKDEIDNKINIINAEKIENQTLKFVTINQFTKDYQNLGNILADEINIKNKNWKIKKANISNINGKMEIKENIFFKSNFNSKIINTLFSDLSSLNFFELKSLKNDYKKLGYSLTDINVHYQRLLSYPFYLTIMTLFGSIVMLNIKRNKSKIFHIILGIFFSVLIYYINYFSALLGENEKLPEVLSIWLPLIVISLFCTIGLVNINEK